eukprot:scaffold89426_cov17-Prasinocladus_malaysianus.AAC.1
MEDYHRCAAPAIRFFHTVRVRTRTDLSNLSLYGTSRSFSRPLYSYEFEFEYDYECSRAESARRRQDRLLIVVASTSTSTSCNG